MDARSDDVLSEDPGDEDSTWCRPPGPTSSAWTEQSPVAREHVVDGVFGADEWEGVVPLQGVFTDMYLDFEAPYLYVLNDWRLNPEGIRPDCFNEFGLNTTGAGRIVVRVYGDGRVTVDDVEVEGAGGYSLSSSPRWDTPHTIFEFRVEVAGDVAVCAKDPSNYSNCEDLTDEPVVYSIRTGVLPIRVARVPLSGVAELVEGAACGYGEGICEEGLSCVEDGGTATCVDPDAPDPDNDGEDAGSSDVVEDVMDDPFPEDVDFPDEPSPDADPD